MSDIDKSLGERLKETSLSRAEKEIERLRVADSAKSKYIKELRDALGEIRCADGEFMGLTVEECADIARRALSEALCPT